MNSSLNYKIKENESKSLIGNIFNSSNFYNKPLIEYKKRKMKLYKSKICNDSNVNQDLQINNPHSELKLNSFVISDVKQFKQFGKVLPQKHRRFHSTTIVSSKGISNDIANVNNSNKTSLLNQTIHDSYLQFNPQSSHLQSSDKKLFIVRRSSFQIIEALRKKNEKKENLKIQKFENKNYNLLNSSSLINDFDSQKGPFSISIFDEILRISAKNITENFKKKNFNPSKYACFKEKPVNDFFEKALNNVLRKVIYYNEKHVQLCEDYVINLIHNEILNLGNEVKRFNKTLISRSNSKSFISDYKEMIEDDKLVNSSPIQIFADQIEKKENEKKIEGNPENEVFVNQERNEEVREEDNEEIKEAVIMEIKKKMKNGDVIRFPINKKRIESDIKSKNYDNTNSNFQENPEENLNQEIIKLNRYPDLSERSEHNNSKNEKFVNNENQSNMENSEQISVPSKDYDQENGKQIVRIPDLSRSINYSDSSMNNSQEMINRNYRYSERKDKISSVKSKLFFENSKSNEKPNFVEYSETPVKLQVSDSKMVKDSVNFAKKLTDLPSIQVSNNFRKNLLKLDKIEKTKQNENLVKTISVSNKIDTKIFKIANPLKTPVKNKTNNKSKSKSKSSRKMKKSNSVLNSLIVEKKSSLVELDNSVVNFDVKNEENSNNKNRFSISDNSSTTPEHNQKENRLEKQKINFREIINEEDEFQELKNNKLKSKKKSLNKKLIIETEKKAQINTIQGRPTVEEILNKNYDSKFENSAISMNLILDKYKSYSKMVLNSPLSKRRIGSIGSLESLNFETLDRIRRMSLDLPRDSVRSFNRSSGFKRNSKTGNKLIDLIDVKLKNEEIAKAEESLNKFNHVVDDVKADEKLNEELRKKAEILKLNLSLEINYKLSNEDISKDEKKKYEEIRENLMSLNLQQFDYNEYEKHLAKYKEEIENIEEAKKNELRINSFYHSLRNQFKIQETLKARISNNCKVKDSKCHNFLDIILR